MLLSSKLAIYLLSMIWLATGALPAVAQDASSTDMRELREISESYEFPPELLDLNIDPSELDVRIAPLTREELAALAGQWLLGVQAKSHEVAAAHIAVRQADGDAKAAARATLDRLIEERQVIFDSFSVVLDGWERKGAMPEGLQAFRAYRAAVLREEARAADFTTLYNQFVGWLTDPAGAMRVATRIAVAIGCFYGLFLVARIASRLVARRVKRLPGTSKLLQASLSRVAYWGVLFVGLMLVLTLLGFDIALVFALFGGASFIIGFALQDTLANLANGLMILVNRPFDEGDTVEIGGVVGKVKNVSIVATTITTLDNRDVVIPNRQVWGNIIANATANETRRVLLDFAIGYDDDITQAISVIRETVAAHPKVLDFPETSIMVGELAERYVRVLCRPWTKTEDFITVKWDLTQQVKENLGKAGFAPHSGRFAPVTLTPGSTTGG